jgi:hypothetical protein
MSFNDQLSVGKVGESLIARYMMSRGHTVLPVYEIEKSSGKGPQLFGMDRDLVAPDMLVFTANGAMFIEAKHKSVFTWHRRTQQWTTGIDLRHYGDYLRVGKQTHLPVWLMFYHRESKPDERDVSHGCPSACPTGLYGGDLFGLVIKENHRSEPFDASRSGFVGHGKSGMVYWAESSLRLLAAKDEVEKVSEVVF